MKIYIVCLCDVSDKDPDTDQMMLIKLIYSRNSSLTGDQKAEDTNTISERHDKLGQM